METTIAVIDDRVVGEGSDIAAAVADAIDNGGISINTILGGELVIYQMVGTARIDVEAG